MRIDSTTYNEFQNRKMPERIECARINLIKPIVTENTLAGCFRLYADSNLGKFNLWKPVISIPEMENRIELFERQWCQNIRFRWLLEHKINGEILGDIVIVRIDERWNEIEVGFNLAADYHKRGYMNEALSKLIEFSLKEFKLNRITALICSQNTAAIKTVRKLNFVLCGTYPRAFKKDDLIDDIQIWQLLEE